MYVFLFFTYLFYNHYRCLSTVFTKTRIIRRLHSILMKFLRLFYMIFILYIHRIIYSAFIIDFAAAQAYNRY